MSVSTSGDSPCTVTVCCVVPIFSTALISVVRPVCTCTLSKICDSKPVFATVNWYRPKVTEVNVNAPLACVLPFCTTFVSRSFSSSPARRNGRACRIGHRHAHHAGRSRLAIQPPARARP